MKVFLNNKEICVGSRCTVKDILAGQNLHVENIAVAVNNRVVLRPDWNTTYLSDGDKVVVISAAYGG